MKAVCSLFILGGALVVGSGERGAVPFGAHWTVGVHRAEPLPSPVSRDFSVIVLQTGIRNSMSAVWAENNRHWDELADVNTLTQMLGTGKPTQREYLGCLYGAVERDTLWVQGWAAAANLKQLQFAVAGDCDHVAGFVGSWHTHPYRADLANLPVKERRLSEMDLATFAAGRDLVTLVMWDVDSLDAAARGPDGGVRYPVPLEVR